MIARNENGVVCGWDWERERVLLSILKILYPKKI